MLIKVNIIRPECLRSNWLRSLTEARTSLIPMNPFAVYHVSNPVRSGFPAFQPHRSPRFEAPERPGHGSRSRQTGRFRIGPHLRHPHGADICGQYSHSSFIEICFSKKKIKKNKKKLKIKKY